MLPAKYFYPAVFHYAEDGISISFPDIPGCLSCSETTEDAFNDAKEALGLHLWSMEQDKEIIPNPTPVNLLTLGPNEILVLIEVFMPTIRDKLNNRFVKKTLSIPSWLNSEAENAGVNFSQILQEALKDRLGLQ